MKVEEGEIPLPCMACPASGGMSNEHGWKRRNTIDPRATWFSWVVTEMVKGDSNPANILGSRVGPRISRASDSTDYLSSVLLRGGCQWRWPHETDNIIELVPWHPNGGVALRLSRVVRVDPHQSGMGWQTDQGNDLPVCSWSRKLGRGPKTPEICLGLRLSTHTGWWARL